MRVLFIAWRDLAHPRAGGSEVVVDILASGLRLRGHEVTLLCGGPIGPRSYPVVPNGGTYSQYLTAPLRYARCFRDADVVVDVVNGMPYFSPLWRRRPRLALVTHVHTQQWARYFPRPVAAAASIVERRGLWLAYRNTRFLTISPSSQADLSALGIDPARIHILLLGSSVDDASGSVDRSPEPVFLALGRLAPNKRLDLLLDHWKRVSPQTGGRLVIAGDGPERAHLAERVRSEHALGDVVLEGRVSEARKAELLRQAWLLVHTAEHEGWGLAILEAARCGTPALAYNAPGVRDAVQDGTTGVLVAGDDAFVDQWVALAADDQWRARLGAAAAERAVTFTWERTVDQFLEAAEAAIGDYRSFGADAPRRRDPQIVLGTAAPAGAMPGAPPRGVMTGAPESRRNAAHHPLAAGPTKGLARSIHLFKLFRREGVDPDRFYHYLAADVVRQIARFSDPSDALAVDIGGGPGYIAEAIRAAGARCVVVDESAEELRLHDRKPESAVQCDATALALRDGTARIVCSSNMLEHVAAWPDALAEMVRVLEPVHGLGYLTFGNWYSPWGGHETAPWHYLGGHRAADRYARRHGRRPKNEFGVSLFRLDVQEVLDWFSARGDVEIVLNAPRYWPDWLRWVAHVRGLREVANWNTLIIFRRTSDPAGSGTR